MNNLTLQTQLTRTVKRIFTDRTDSIRKSIGLCGRSVSNRGTRWHKIRWLFWAASVGALSPSALGEECIAARVVYVGDPTTISSCECTGASGDFISAIARFNHSGNVLGGTNVDPVINNDVIEPHVYTNTTSLSVPKQRFQCLWNGTEYQDPFLIVPLPVFSIATTTNGAENNGAIQTDTVFTVTVTPTNISGSPITGSISYSGSATNGNDYATGATTFSIANNAATTTVTLDVTEDELVESTETITATISNPSTGTIGTASATANLTDDDSYSVSIADTAAGAENNGGSPTDAVFTVTVTPINISGSPITGIISYSGSATNGNDYATGATTFGISNNTSTVSVTLDVTEDSLVEGTETITATISNPSTGTIGTASATANLTDDDSYSISIAGTTAGAENNGGSPTDAVFTVTVTPTNISGSPITGSISYSGSATNGTDYTTGTTTFSIPNNTSTASVTLDVTEDNLDEGTETITATLSSPSAGSIGIASDSIDLTDDDAAPVITSTANTIATENTVYTYAPTATDANNDPLTWSISGEPAGMSINPVTGVVSWTPTGGVTTSGAVTLTVSDGALIDTQTFTVTVTLITDGDGVSDAEEQAAPNSGDGNNDGISDHVQSNVASVKGQTAKTYYTIDATNSFACRQLSNISTTTEAALGTDPGGFDYEAGLVNFSLNCSRADIVVYFHGLTKAPEQIRKYGFTPTSTGTRVWYQMPDAVVDTVTIVGETVYRARYTLVDGGLGDDDLTVNGTLVDPVGAAQQVVPGAGGTTATSIPTLSEWVQYVLMLLLAGVGARAHLWRKELFGLDGKGRSPK